MRKQVLIIEDDTGLANALREVLEGADYLVKWAKNGRAALEHLRRATPISMIFLDLSMPVMNGWQFREEQMRDPILRWIPVVLMTAIANGRREAKAMNVEGYLAKPIRPEQLLDAARQLC